MQRRFYTGRFFSVPDLVILLFLGTLIYGMISIATEWSSEFRPVVWIDLSLRSLPYYALLSGIRGVVAYGISLIFTLFLGYFAAKSSYAEKMVIPLLDIFQSIPVLGFLPGLIIGLVALFPHTNLGLELAAILMIFTGQVWNMTFSFYSSLKSIPINLKEVSTNIGLNWYEKLLKLELPFSAVNLAWNSVLSMAGGWFFLIPCEAMTLGDREYRLPGIGSYMSVAIQSGNQKAICFGILAMIVLIVVLDFFIWRPVLSWVQKFRLEAGQSMEESLMENWLRESKILQGLNFVFRKQKFRRYPSWRFVVHLKFNLLKIIFKTHRNTSLRSIVKTIAIYLNRLLKTRWIRSIFFVIKILFVLIMFCFILYFTYKLFKILEQLSLKAWISLMIDTCFTLSRLLFALVLSTLWTVPLGIWLGTSSQRIRIAQPIIQILASFPAPMLYPLVLKFLFSVQMNFQSASAFLILIGVPWYILFNVLAGALRISAELSDALAMMQASRWDCWKVLYLPSIFPSLVTGWMTAMGAAWNATVFAEHIAYQGEVFVTRGLGATLGIAISHGDYTLFAASLVWMILVVVVLNRLVWARLYQFSQTRFIRE